MQLPPLPLAGEGASVLPVPLTPAFLSDPALIAVLDALPSARLVGGCVRDAIAGVPSSDIDLATPEPPEQVVRALAAAGLKSAPTGLAHGTVTAISDHRGFEVTTLRRDVATDGRHAEVAWTDDWQEDAARRDFTMNAMSMTRDGTIYDYFDGARDLAAGQVRFVGEPSQRIAEDYLRIPRFFRFHARYGHGTPDPAALDAIRAGVPGLARLSPERVWGELKRIFATAEPLAAVRLMAELGVLDALLPGADPARLDRLLATEAPPDSLLRLAAVRPRLAELAEPLRMSLSERDRLLAWDGPAPAPDMDDDALRRLLADAPAGSVAGRAWLAGHAMTDRLAALPRPVFPVEGRDVVQLGIPSGPAVGAHLRAVRAWWMAGGCRADRAACLDELRAELARAAPG